MGDKRIYAHSKTKRMETKTTLTFEKIAKNSSYMPTLHDLPENAKIIFIGKDPRPHGHFILIYKIADEEHLAHGPEKKANVLSSQCFCEEPYFYSECGHKLSKIFELEIGQFIYFPGQPQKSKINGHSLKVYQPQKNSE